MPHLEDLPILYSFRRCPYAMRARLALLVAGVPCVLREVALKNKPQAMLALAPQGTVPVLVLPDGRVLAQSLDIMRFALDHKDPLAWLPHDEVDRARQQAWVERNDGPFKFALDRYKYPQRFGLGDNSAYRLAGEQYLGELNDWLCHNRALAGAHFGYADAAIAPFVRQWAHTDAARFASADWSALQAWLQAFEQFEGFALVMEKYPVWEPSQAPVHFPALPAAITAQAFEAASVQP